MKKIHAVSTIGSGLTKSGSEPDRSLCKTSINPLDEVPWGSHVCLFYETKQDLLDANISYFKAGLENKERGLWGLSDPIGMDDAINALRQGVPDFDRHLTEGNIELVDGRDCYMDGAQFELDKVIRRWQRKYYGALASGHKGLRISGNALWRQSEFWKEFCDYERALDSSMAGHRMSMLCTYSLSASPARDLMDVACAHQCTIVRRKGEWDYLEVSSWDKAMGATRLLDDDLDALPSSFAGEEQLTQREKMILVQIINGASNKDTAKALKISPRTVEFHRANIMQKLGAKNGVELVRLVVGRR